MPRLTAGPPDAKINGQGFRTYRWKGRELLSVTSIRKLCGEPFGLVAWQIGKVIDRALGEEYQSQRNGVFVDGNQAADILRLRKWLRAATTEDRDKAANKGLDIHGALELGLAPEDCNEETRPYIHQVNHFLRETGWKIVAQEQQVFNLSVGYAGTLDVIFQRPDGVYVVGDWKSSKSVYVDHVVQLHAYLNGEFVGLRDVVQEDMTTILNQTTEAGILHLNGKDPHEWKWHDVTLRDDVTKAFYGSVWFAQLLSEHSTPDALFSGHRKGMAST